MKAAKWLIPHLAPAKRREVLQGNMLTALDEPLRFSPDLRGTASPRPSQEGVWETSKAGIETCPFSNLPEKSAGRWGQGLTAAEMKECRWLKPVTVAQFEFVEWTPENHLRHTTFVGLREDKAATEVVREP
jgi:hypothetical protein